MKSPVELFVKTALITDAVWLDYSLQRKLTFATYNTKNVKTVCNYHQRKYRGQEKCKLGMIL